MAKTKPKPAKSQAKPTGSATKKGAAAEKVSHADAVAHAEHPSDMQYIKVAIVLAVITAVEVLLYYKELPGVILNNTALGVLAIVKFAIVALYFMHLKFDTRLLRRFFIGGILLAMFCYIVVLLMFGIWVG